MSILAERDTQASSSNINDSNLAKNSEPIEVMHTFQEGMGNHPLWQEYLAELEASRQADIAEANRRADLELES